MLQIVSLFSLKLKIIVISFPSFDFLLSFGQSHWRNSQELSFLLSLSRPTLKQGTSWSWGVLDIWLDRKVENRFLQDCTLPLPCGLEVGRCCGFQCFIFLVRLFQQAYPLSTPPAPHTHLPKSMHLCFGRLSILKAFVQRIFIYPPALMVEETSNLGLSIFRSGY